MFNKEKTLLFLMLEAIEKILKYADGFNAPHELEGDTKTFDACLVNFIVLGETTEKLSSKYKNAQKHIDWESIQKLKNVLSFNSVGMLPEEIWTTIRFRLPELYQQLKNLTSV